MIFGSDTNAWKNNLRANILVQKLEGRTFVSVDIGRAENRLELVRHSNGRQTFGRTVILNPEWIDSSTMKRWKKDCINLHGTSCRGHSRIERLPHAAPSFLIDVWKSRLVPAQDGDRYIALSYVWGREEFLKTTRDNVERFQTNGAFSASDLRIPKPIRDAMLLVDILEEPVPVGGCALYCSG
jgi:hypothetical protein